MTLSTTAPKTSFVGNDVTTSFATSFAFFGTGTTAELTVTERVIATGAETVLTNPTHYSVTGGNGSTGTVTAVSAPSSSVHWIIRRATSKSQETDYTNNDPFPADTHERALDRLTMIVQENSESAERGLRFPETDSSSLSAVLPSSVDRASGRLGFDANGEPIIVTADVTGVAATAFGQSMAEAADSAAGTALLDAADSSAAGIVELATAAETTTGTDATRAVTPDGLAGGNYGKAVASILVFDDAITCATGDGAGDVFWRVPAVLNGWNLVDVAACVQTAGTTGTMTIQVHNATQTADMLSTRITIDTGEVDTLTAAAAAVIDASNDDVATGDRIRIDVDGVHTTPAKGLLVELTFQLP